MKVAIMVGRWQILQRGHGTLLRAALAQAQQVVIVIGSAHRSRDAWNPFTWQERQQMFECTLSAEERSRVAFLPVRDYYDEERCIDAVRSGVARLTSAQAEVTLVAFKQDHTSMYLDAFPGWRLHEVEQELAISATDLRRIYFEAGATPAALTAIGNYVEPNVRDYLAAWAHLPVYRQMALEHQAVEDYRRKYTQPFSLTADALVTAQDHALLIKRGGTIGHGLWALPGGFLEVRERFYAAAVRELAEETGLKLDAQRLQQALRAHAVFDHPSRSVRGRIVTAVYHFDLGDGPLPEVQGADDAKEARWVPIAELPQLEEQLFEDHATILDHFVGLFPPAA